MGSKGYVLAGIVSIGYVSVWIGFGFLRSAWGQNDDDDDEGACAKGQLGVQRLVDCDGSMTDTFWNYWLKKTSCGRPATALQTVLVSSKVKIGKCFTCLSPVWIARVFSFLGRLPLIPAGETGTIPHSMQGRMDTCSPQAGGECDNMVRSGTGSCHVFPSDHPVTVWTENPNTNSFLQYQQYILH